MASSDFNQVYTFPLILLQVIMKESKKVYAMKILNKFDMVCIRACVLYTPATDLLLACMHIAFINDGLSQTYWML